jgi:hypothetical protein
MDAHLDRDKQGWFALDRPDCASIVCIVAESSAGWQLQAQSQALAPQGRRRQAILQQFTGDQRGQMRRPDERQR